MILCCGEALIDMLPCRTAAGAEAFTPVPGGAVLNTAVALGRLGVRAGLLSGLSRDLFGEALVRALSDAGADTALAVRSDRPTTLAFVRIEDGQARYAFYDENTAGRMLHEADLPPVPEGVTAQFFGGISLVAEPCGTAYEALQARAADAGRVTMLDPNIRDAFITDPVAYRARIERMIGRADIVKLSDEDLRWLSGEGRIAALVQDILGRGPRAVFVTEGARGATGYTATDEVFVPAVATGVVDTVGAGDTFNAGVLAALHSAGALDPTTLTGGLSGRVLEAALTLGVRAAAITVSRAGANPPWAHELG